ncbi:hypothetical protein [Demequina muriae]|uniref:Uncharacterized protein n=1 Tax=Demequina muriae TaxID=3051664 RepID=A0ABT8GGI4_9MICO|nr:hypothetical protein [Demequina sp. EGI L300058]MDN4480381.1 hypothetical protein [Demequina sp. EGI L300058]
MNSDGTIAIDAIIDHCLYGVFAHDPTVESRAATAGGSSALRSASIALKTFSIPAEDLVFHVSSRLLPPWPNFVGVSQVFSGAAKAAIERHLTAKDRMRFARYPVTLLDGVADTVHLALPTEHIDVLSSWSTVAPNGVAQWWALDLHKLAHRSFFVVPEARSNTVMRGDLLLALHELGWPGYAYELRVMDGKHMVSYEEWAEHPEWTGYEPPA